ncbi:ACT domain-containing protein [Nakamurella antarctica]|uniref:ACT domain-containing protein n=1 Tax=Nakamurella antarctica TaxID=1902245 RepID=UPI001EF107A8|nr:ACT domain-containing protein [Nakamurella antarctica]
MAVDLAALLHALQPRLDAGEYVFVSVPGAPDLTALTVLAFVAEDEGATLVIPRGEADNRCWAYDFVAARITLLVHSPLAAVGLTAAVAGALGEAGIACNVIAGFFHDHLYVPVNRADEAMTVLRKLAAG